MKIHRLEIEGFGPFRDRQVVDFDAFADDGIFLIAGKTGAGKSSVLDAICFALYGGVPRYIDGDKRLRSDHSALDEPTRVVLDFSTGGRRLRVERVPSYERLKKSGHGTTVSAAQARLDEWIDGEWRGVAARAVDVGHELGPILGLTQQQFLQVILLAQGKFAQFLHASNDERQALLRTLFDSHRFSDYEKLLDDRRREVEALLERESATLDGQLDAAQSLLREVDSDFPAASSQLARLETVHSASLHAAHSAELAGAAEETARHSRTAADAAHAVAVSGARSQEQRAVSRTALEALESRRPSVDADRQVLAAAMTAETLRPAIASAERAHAAEETARRDRDAAERDWTDAGRDASIATIPDPSALDTLADDLLGRSTELRAAAELEADLPKREAAERAAHAIVDGIDERLRAHQARRGELPAEIAAAAGRVSAAAIVAAAATDAAQRVVVERARLAAAEEAEELAGVVTIAEASALAEGRALTRASAALDDLRERRFRDHAGELAERLTDGEPCDVCGAREHPAPAVRHDEPVTDELIAAAEAAKAAAVRTDRDATNRLHESRQAWTDAAARAAGLSVADATLSLDVAVAAQQKTDIARRDHDRFTSELRLLETELTALDDALAALNREKSEAGNALLLAVHRVTEARDTIAAARGEYASVADRLAADLIIVGLARRLASAQRAADTAAVDVVAAAKELDDQLAAAHLGDLADVRAALRSRAERDRLDTDIRRYDADVAAQKQTLLALEMEFLPDEPIDVTVTAAARDRATEAWRSAVAGHTAASRLSAQLAEAYEAASIAYEAIASASEEARTIRELANAVAGRAPNTMKMNLETFVLAAELEEIVAQANLRLAEMSEGRYLLQHTDARAARGRASGLGIDVMDQHTGQSRPVQSLSGGETFLASLALALGLAQVVTERAGGIRLDTLFIDEGFGSLDADTLEIAMRTLDELRAGGRIVGIISHVETIKAEIPARLLVETTAEGPSVIRQDASIPY